jgi:RNA polymerase sigma-70 factor (ECF subfamily)
VDAEPTDVELLARWRAGDTAAASALLQRHFLAIYRFFAASVRASEAEDLTQRTFEACIVARDRIVDDAAFRGFLFGIAHHQLASHLTRGRPRGEHVPASAAELVDRRTSPSGVLVRDDERELFARALERLSPKLREILELFYWQDRSIAEIATQLGISVGTVKSRLHRAREQVAEHLHALDAAGALARATLASLHSKEIPVES